MWIQDQLRAAIETKQQHEGTIQLSYMSKRELDLIFCHCLAFMKDMRLEEIELERKKELRAEKLEARKLFVIITSALRHHTQ
jgi:hypothetical protein